MPDKDLRRQVLGSGKTVSRKAKSKQESREGSRPNSTPNSRPASRNASRQPSDEEEDDNLSDGTAWSVNSADDFLALEDDDEDLAKWQTDLSDRIEELLDRKRSNTQSREECLAAIVRMLSSHWACRDIQSKTPELISAFAKSIKAETSEKEAILGLKAIALTIITTTEKYYYQMISPLLKRTIMTSESLPTKAAAIHCLGVCTFFGGAVTDEILEQMAFLLEIVSSDGNSIEAADDPTTVTAALEEWGFLATAIDDFAAESEEAIEALVDQLDSSDASVQIAAGENIALLYEKSYADEYVDESDDEDPAEEHSFSDDEDAERFAKLDHSSSDDELPGVRLGKGYNAYHNTPQLLNKLAGLATLHGHKVSKRSKKNVRSSFQSIQTTVRDPRLGPRYNTAQDPEGHHFGSRMTLRIHRNGEMKVDRWWKWMRLGALRRVLQGGFVSHYYEGNRAVLDSLPVMMVQKEEKLPGGRCPKPSGRMKGSKSRAWELGSI